MMRENSTFHVDRTLVVQPTVSVAPAQEPVLLEEMLAHARIEAPDEEALMAGNIIAARRWMEAYTNRAFIAQTWVASLNRFPLSQEGMIELPGGKLQSVSSITYVDLAGATQTWDASEYEVHTEFQAGRVGLAYGKNWPSVREWGLPIIITYVVGYGDDPSDVPEEIRASIRMLALELFENRQESDDVSLSAVPWGAEKLASRYRIMRLA